MTKIAIYLGLTGAAVIALVFFIQNQRDIGGAVAREKQEKENAKMLIRVRKGAVDYNTCDRAGGLYDFVNGTCKLPLNGTGR